MEEASLGRRRGVLRRSPLYYHFRGEMGETRLAALSLSACPWPKLDPVGFRPTSCPFGAANQVFPGRDRLAKAQASWRLLLAEPHRLAQRPAVEPDCVLDVPVVWQVATLAEIVDVRCRAAKEFRNLGHVERGPVIPRPAVWHTVGT